MREELPNIVAAPSSAGAPPHYTLSKVLQELRDEGLVEFLEKGSYLLQDTNIDVDDEDLTDEAIDHAIRARRLILREIETANSQVLGRRRKGQDRLRRLSLDQYSNTCALCDLSDRRLLIASHILPWSESEEFRGRLDNVICLCRFHDTLFEYGYWSLSDELTVVKRNNAPYAAIRVLLDGITIFRAPTEFVPAIDFVRGHRARFGFV